MYCGKINVTSIKTKTMKGPGMGHNSQHAEKSEQAQEIIDAPHSENIKAAARGECDDVSGIAGKRLKSFIERLERLEEEKKGLSDDIKDVLGEAKATGFDVKAIRKILRLRKMDIEKRREEDEILELYKAAIGME